MPRGFHLARIAGIDVYLDWSLAIIFMLVTFSLGAVAFPAWHPQWGPGTVWLTAVAAAVLFFASVLIHELSHALVGRRFGIDVPTITLFVFGGMAQMREEPHAWRPELLMAIAGPLTSLLLGAFFIWLGTALTGPLPDTTDPEAFLSALSPPATLFFWLGPINVILGLFNLVPGFPLDGGRVLRAALWGATGDLVRATRWASNAGRGVAWLLIATGFAMALGVRVPFFGTGVGGGLWLALIGWFLHNAAVSSYRQLLVRESLLDVPVRRLMVTEQKTVTPGLTVRRFVDEHLLRGDQRAFPVVDGGRLVGLVCLKDVHRLPREEWDARLVADIMTAVGELATVSPDDDGVDALNALNRRNVNQIPVVDGGGRVVGIVRREDVLRWLAVYGDRRLGFGGS
ncbi:MAG TPA: site-2 protease family protein [Gammaproteobacteria bacterium]